MQYAKVFDRLTWKGRQLLAASAVKAPKTGNSIFFINISCCTVSVARVVNLAAADRPRDAASRKVDRIVHVAEAEVRGPSRR